MLAAYYTTPGAAHDVLQIGTRPDPNPGPGEVLVRLHASGINPADTKRRGAWQSTGMAHPLIIPHADGAGEIIEVGADVDPARLGERVWLWNAQGSYGEPGRAFGTAAELIAIPSPQAVLLPKNLTFAQGAKLGIPAMTAFGALYTDGAITGKTIAVLGAAGAVGYITVQMAVADGARVIGVVSNANDAERILGAGAFATINRKQEDIASRVLELTAGRGVDRVIDVDFGANIAVDAAMITRNGVIAAYSSSTNPNPLLPYYAFAIKGVTLRFIQSFHLPETLRLAGQQKIATLAASGQLDVHVGKVFRLTEIASAHEAIENGTASSVILSIRED